MPEESGGEEVSAVHDQEIESTSGICLVCHRKLKDPLSIRLGVGPVCRKKMQMDPEVLKEIREEGLDGVPVPGGIQMMIPEDSERRTG